MADVIRNPYGEQYRPLWITDTASQATRGAWFRPQPVTARPPVALISFMLLLLAIAVVTYFLLTQWVETAFIERIDGLNREFDYRNAANPPWVGRLMGPDGKATPLAYGIYLAPLGTAPVLVAGLIAFWVWRRRRLIAAADQANAPVPALRVDVMVQERENARRRAKAQARIDLAADPTEWEDAVRSGRVVTLASADYILPLGRVTLSPRVEFTTSAALDRGLAVHRTTWNAERGDDPRAGAFSRGQPQLVPWSAVSRLHRSGHQMVIETMGGSSIRLDLRGGDEIAADLEGSAADGYDHVISPYILQFYDAVQRKVMTARS